MSENWQARVDAVWAAADDLGDDEVIARIDALAAERGDDALALFERAGARDSAGLEVEAEGLYRASLASGLPEWEEGRATIQLASTIRNLDRPEESVRMLRDFFADRPEHPLAASAAAFLGLALASAGRPVEGLAEVLRGVAPTLPRYQRSVRAYADELAERLGQRVPDRSFVVTGGARGIGAEIARVLAEYGHVVIVDRDEPDGTLPPRAEVLTGDAGDPATADRAAASAERVAPLTGWVNNAAVFRDAAIRSASADELAELVMANLRPSISGCHAAIRHFLEHGRSGSIVNISSHQAQRAVRGALPYATAKAAVEGLTRALAVDHGPDGIRVNAVALGSIATARYDAFRAAHPEVDAQMAALHPLGRVGSPTEVARVVEFLLSDASAFLTGAIVPVDGGRAAQGGDPESH